MNENTALRMLSRVMSWSPEKCKDEFEWLRLISAVKYDNYRDFVAGVRFLESLVGWLLQFEAQPVGSSDRDVAYDFVRNQLTFIGLVERERLVELLYPRDAMPLWLDNVARHHDIQPWQVNTIPQAAKDLEVERRRTLFLGLSDGARLDSFRHVNVGRISNEQVVTGTELHHDKWDRLKEDLETDLRALGATADPTFRTIFLVDDFAGSGSSFLRTEPDGKGGIKWKGKLKRFLETLQHSGAYDPDWTLVVHHLVMTRDAALHLEMAIPQFMKECSDPLPWFSRSKVTSSLQYHDSFKVDPASPFGLLTNKYYDQRIETSATAKGKVPHIGLGYAGCALPLILDHNTPNNSVALLWAESRDDQFPLPEPYANPARRMRPLFRRRQRHLK